MLSLIRFELEKIFQKKLILITLLCMVLFTYVMIYNWIAPGYAGVVIEENGSLITLAGKDAVLRNQEICARYAGPLTNEKVRQILAEYQWADELTKSSGLDVSQAIHYTHNLLYNALTSRDFTDADGIYNGTDITQAYGEIAPSLTLGYYEGWEGTLFSLTYILLSWGCVVAIFLSPVFSEEYTRGTDALILTGTNGRAKCSTAKLIAAFAVTLTGTLLIIISATLALLLYHGTAGFDASVQITNLGFLEDTPYVLSWGSAYGFACLLWIGSILVLSAVTLLVSAVAKSSFTALVISFAIYAIPMFIPWARWKLGTVGAFFPINQMQLMYLFSLNELQLGALSFPVMWMVIPITIALLVLGIIFSKRAFARHQVV